MDMNPHIRGQFRAFQNRGDLDGLAAYSQKWLQQEQASDLMRGCCLWNLSDVYAMKRSCDALYANHRLFSAHVQTMPPEYSLWLVCDATQRLSLELGGYDGFWWDAYEQAIEKNRGNGACEPVMFEALRAAFYPNPIKPHARLHNVADHFQTFLDHVQRAEDRVFYRLIYGAMCMRNGQDAGMDVMACCRQFFPDLTAPDAPSGYAAGEWAHLNSRRSEYHRAQTAVISTIHGLIDMKDSPRARQLYADAQRYGLPPNAYVDKRLA